LTHRVGDAVPAVRAADVAAALEEAVDDVAGGRAGDGDLEVVEVGEGGRVDEGGEYGVDVGLVRGARAVFWLSTAAVYEGIDGGG